MEQKINSLYRAYKKGEINRREFIQKVAFYTGSTAAAFTMLGFSENSFANATVRRQDDLDDSDLVSEFITYPGETGDVKAYFARPKAEKKYPAVIVIHEIWGLVPHIHDVSRRMAKEGFLSLAPDGLSPFGGTPEEPTDNMGEMISKLQGEQVTKNFVAAVKYLKTHPLSNGKVGCTGFCWGGSMTNQVAVLSPDLDAAVPYYGGQPAEDQVPMIKCPIMAHYGANDERINAGIPAFEEALKKSGLEYQIYMYEGAGHAFNNDSNPNSYNKEAADLAWERTIGFFKEKLGG